jgi:hypothetical protein
VVDDDLWPLMTVTYLGDSGWSAGVVADTSLLIPGTAGIGDMIVVIASWKDFGITAQVAGYTELIEIADGSVVTGNGTGSMKVGVWYKEHSGSEGTPTVDFSTTVGLIGGCALLVYRKTEATWQTPLAVSAAWPVTAVSQTINASSTVAVPSNGHVLGILGLRDDSAFAGLGETIDDAGGLITWTSAAVATPTSNASTTTGNDMSAVAYSRPVTTGSAGATLNFAQIISAVETGMIVWVVLGDVAAATTFPPRPVIVSQAVNRASSF